MDEEGEFSHLEPETWQEPQQSAREIHILAVPETEPCATYLEMLF